MKKLFFFPPQKSNEWMTFELFRGKEKKQKKHTKIREKKHKQLLLKKGNFIKIWMNDRWIFPQEKKTRCFFFFQKLEKKTRFSDLNEWMANIHAHGNKKIRYLCFSWYSSKLLFNPKRKVEVSIYCGNSPKSFGQKHLSCGCVA